MPDVVLGSICALAGSLLMFVVQEFSRSRERAQLSDERRASDLTAALATFAESLLRYRQLQLTRCRSVIQEEEESPDHAFMRREARAEAWAAYFTARMTGMSTDTADTARALLDATRDLAGARFGPSGVLLTGDKAHEHLDARGDAIRDGVERLIDSIDGSSSPGRRGTL